MMKSRNERIAELKKTNQKKMIRKSAGIVNTSIIMASLAIPTFSVLASAEENATTSERVIKAVADSSNSASDTATEIAPTPVPVDPETPIEETPEIPKEEVEVPETKPETPETKPEVKPETPGTKPVAPIVETKPTPKVEVETTRPFSKEEVSQQNIAEVQVPEANHSEAEKIMFVKNQSTQEFIDKISEFAAEIGAEKDLYASVMIAQAILESGSGNSSLSSEPNYNLFGIKGTFENQSVALLTLEDDGSGNYYQITGEFRKYPSYKESLEDYSKLLTGGTSFNASFYSGTWKSNTTSYKDATAFLTGKYATDTRYAEKLDQLIETYDLTQYDDGVKKVSETEVQQDVMHTIVSGDTLWDLGNTFGVSVQELMEWNQLTSDLIFVNQELIVKKAPVAPPVVAPVENVSAAATDTKKVEDTNTNLTGFQQKQNGTLAFDETTSDLNQGSVKEEYQVAEGDSLYTISKKFNVSPLEIKHWNDMKHNLLFIGQTLTIHTV